MIDLTFLPVDITKQISKFRDFLLASWKTSEALFEDHDWDEDPDSPLDWIQINWEFLVERELLGKGHVFPGICAIRSSRITLKEKKPDYAVFVISKKGKLRDINDLIIPKNKKLRFFSLIGRGQTHQRLGYYPPFDIVDVVIDEKEIFRVHFDDVNFIIDRYEGVN